VSSGYKYGFHVTSSNNNKILLTLNARSDHDRSRFVDDLKEAILEVRSRVGAMADLGLGKGRSSVVGFGSLEAGPTTAGPRSRATAEVSGKWKTGFRMEACRS